MKVFTYSCRDCPLLNVDDEYGHGCNHPDEASFIKEADIMTEPNVVGVPKDCPLRKGILTIELMEGVK